MASGGTNKSGPTATVSAGSAASGSGSGSGGGGGGATASGGSGSGSGGGGGRRTLWVGDLDVWIDELFLFNMFATAGHPPSSAIVMPRPGATTNFGFAEFPTPEGAALALQQLNGTKVACTYHLPFVRAQMLCRIPCPPLSHSPLLLLFAGSQSTPRLSIEISAE